MKPNRLFIEPDAKQDILAARDHYVEISSKISERFFEELEQNFRLFTEFPEAVAIAIGRTRLKPMRQFPYVIGYILHADEIHVTGVQHGALGLAAFHNREFGN